MNEASSERKFRNCDEDSSFEYCERHLYIGHNLNFLEVLYYLKKV